MHAVSEAFSQQGLVCKIPPVILESAAQSPGFLVWHSKLPQSDPKAPSTPYLPFLATISFLFQQNWFFWNQMNRHALSLVALTAPAPRGLLRQAFVWQAGTEAWLIFPLSSLISKSLASLQTEGPSFLHDLQPCWYKPISICKKVLHELRNKIIPIYII